MVSTPGITVFVPGLPELQRCERISDPGRRPYPIRVALALRTPANQRSASGIGVSAQCVAILTRGITVFVPGFVGVVEVWKDFGIGYGTLSSLGVGVSAPCEAVSTPGDHGFCPRFVGVVLQRYGRTSDPEMGPYPPRVALAPQAPVYQRSSSGMGGCTQCAAVST